MKKEIVYKLNLHGANGKHRADLPKNVIYDLSAKYGDLMVAIPGNMWYTSEQVVHAVWNREKKQFKTETKRSRKQIEDGIQELLKNNLLLSK